MAVVLGLNAKLYRGTAGTTAATLLDNVKDVTLTLETGEADVTTRAANGWRITKSTLKTATLEFTMVWNTTDAGFTAIESAFFNGTAIALAALDGSGGSGIDADWNITQFSREEPLEDALTVKVTCKPNGDTRNPSWT